MYFKIIYNALVIDILDSVQYVRWLKRGKKFVKTDMTSANGILASDGLNVYHVEGMPEFDGMGNYKTVHMVEIDEESYNTLKSQMIEGDVVYVDEAAFSTEERLKLEISNLKKQLAAVSNQSHKSTTDLEAIKLENQTLVKQLADVNEQSNKAAVELESVRSENKELLEQISVIRTENAELASQLTAAKILLGVD